MSRKRVAGDAPIASIDPEDERRLVQAALEGDERAWHRLVRRYDGPLREIVRESTDAIQPLTDEQLEDVIGDFWLRMVEDDRRWLRRFRGDSSLETFLRFQALAVAHEHVQRLRREPVTLSFDEKRYVPVARESSPAKRAHADVSGLAALLQLPIEMQALRSDVTQLRAAVEQLRRALPPVLLSVGDAASALGVSTVTVRRMIRNGRLAHVRIGRSVKVDLTKTPVESVNASDGRRAALDLNHR
jgi:excisionase family DNA binding protein